MFSNSYIFRYAAIMVIFVAAVLSATALLLQPAQESNIRAEKIQNILKSANIESTPSNAESLYNQYIVQEIVINSEGEIISIYTNGSFEKGDIRAFNLDLRSQLKIKQQVAAGKTTDQPLFPLFICVKETDTLYIIPLEGNGLWGPIWGNMALQNDLKTIEGVNFDHKAETPGLGAEINTPIFEDQFPGKEILDDDNQFTSIKVVKGGVGNSNIDPAHGVDAISGGTITSVGVEDMLRNNLSNYITYIKTNRQ